ncbi:GTP-binding protein [Streptomyces sp. NPDC088097]|uniref:GTP-binding protein n=1 Tax=Streptomyces sp. NPDC088097 TaxID=3365823 RepID=UPI0037FF6136
MAAHVSGGDLPQLTVFTVGEVGSGKSTLTRALVDVRGEEVSYAAALAGDTVEYTGTRYHYLHTDVPAQDVPARLKGAAPVPDGVILVVSAAEGPGPGVLEHVEAAVGAGVPAVVVFLNQCDRCDDAKAQQDLEDRIAGELGCLRPAPRHVVYVRGSAKLAIEDDDGPYGRQSITRLIEAMDEALLPPLA